MGPAIYGALPSFRKAREWVGPSPMRSPGPVVCLVCLLCACSTPEQRGERLLERFDRIQRAGNSDSPRAQRRQLAITGEATELLPANAGAWARRGEALFEAHRDTDSGFDARQAGLREAEAAFGRALELDPDEGRALVGLAGVRLEHDGAQTLAEAERLLARRTQRVHHDGMAWYLLGTARFRRGDYPGAEQAFLAAVAPEAGLGGNEPVEALRLLGRIYTDEGRFDEAEAILHRSVASLEELRRHEETDNGCPYQALGRLYAQTGRNDEVAALYDQAADQSGTTPVHLFMAALKAYEVGNHVAAAGWLTRAEQSEGDHPGYRDPHLRYDILRGYLALADQDYAEAERRFAAGAADPLAAQVGRGHLALSRRSNAEARRLLQGGAAIDLAAERVGMESTNLDWRSFTWRMANVGLGWVEANEGRHEQAIADFDRVLALHRGDVLAQLGRANSLLILGRAEEALAAYELTLTLSPGNPYARSGRADAFAALGRDAEAETEWVAILEEPGTPFVCPHRGLGLLYLAQGRTDEAAEQLEIAVELEPDIGYHKYLALARIRRSEGQLEQARELVARALANRPEGVEARALAAELGAP